MSCGTSQAASQMLVRWYWWWVLACSLSALWPSVHAARRPSISSTKLLLSSGQSMPLVGLGTGFGDCRSGAHCLGPGAQFYYDALKVGCRLFDTAYIYGSEAPLGEALERAQREGWLTRQDVFIITKPPTESCDSFHLPDSATWVQAALTASLARLRTTYVDCLMLHHTDEAERRGERKGPEERPGE